MATLADAARFLTSALARAADAWSDETLLLSMLRDIGWQLDTAPPQLTAIGSAVQAVEALWRDLENTDASLEQADQIATAISQLWSALRALETMPPPSGLTGFAEDLAVTILDYWLIDALARDGWIALPLLELLGVVEIRYVPEAPPRQRHIVRKIHWELLPTLLSDPGAGFRARYGWGTDAFDASAVLARLQDLLTALRWVTTLRQSHADELEAAGDTSTGLSLCLDLELLRAMRSGVEVEGGIRFLPVRAAATPPGLALVPYVSGGLGQSFPLDDHVTVSVDASFDLQGGVVVAWLPERGISVKVGLGSTGVEAATGHATLELDISDPNKDEKVLIDALGFQFAGTTAAGLTHLDIGGATSFAIEAGIKDGKLRWDPSQAPGVLAAVIGDQKIEIPAALGLGWSSAHGIYLRGGNALGTVFPTTIQLGPLTLSGIRVVVDSVPSGTALSLGTDGKVSIGPFEIGWQGLGVRITLQNQPGGALPIHLAVDPAPPSGVEIAFKSAIVSGGGAIQRTSDDKFTGSLTLDAHGFRIAGSAAVEKIDGHYSIAAIASATWPGIPLGLGFTLDGMTALVGIRRRVDEVAGTALVRTGGIASLFAGSDPLRTLDSLSTLLPAASDRDVVGIGPTIGWGSPRVLEANLAILAELPEPIRIVLLASAQFGLPSLAYRTVDIRLDAIGVLDLARNTLSLDASLHDSKLAGYALSGDLALRLAWGDEPAFLLAIGGFHPHFVPPAGFPTLRRLQLTAGDNPQLRLDAYLALTSNTAQVGAHADLSYHGGGFVISAQAGFDAIFIFSPFQFEAEITASAAITWHGHNLASVSLDFDLTGPHPWHAVGTASFDVLWWSVSVGFDAIWGDASSDALPPPPDIAAQLRDALADPSAWSNRLPSGEQSWLVLASGTTTRFHPASIVAVRQRIVPLGLDVTQLGNTPLTSPAHFAIDHLRLGSDTATTADIQDLFAPAQFIQMSTDDRLAAPSFEKFNSGVELGNSAVTMGAVARASMQSETVLIDPLAPIPRPPRTPVRATLVTALVAARSAPPARAPVGPKLRDLTFVVASASDLSHQSAASTFAAAKAARTAGTQVMPAPLVA